MKHMLTFCSLTFFFSASGMEQLKKCIIMKNRTSDPITLVLRGYKNDEKKDWVCEREKIVNCLSTKKINLYHQSYHRHLVPIIHLLNGTHDLELNIGEEDAIPFGDTITIKPCSKFFKIISEKNQLYQEIQRTDVPLKIGTNPTCLPSSLLFSQKLTVYNRDLAQVRVIIAALGKRSLINNVPHDDFPIESSPLAKHKLWKNDKIIQKMYYTIQKGGVTTFMTFSKQIHPHMIKALTYLYIPQAAQPYVAVNINDGEIRSGDTLKICCDYDDKMIVITNQRTKSAVARLYNRDSNAHLLTHG